MTYTRFPAGSKRTFGSRFIVDERLMSSPRRNRRRRLRNCLCSQIPRAARSHYIASKAEALSRGPLLAPLPSAHEPAPNTVPFTCSLFSNGPAWIRTRDRRIMRTLGTGISVIAARHPPFLTHFAVDSAPVDLPGSAGTGSPLGVPSQAIDVSRNGPSTRDRGPPSLEVVLANLDGRKSLPSGSTGVEPISPIVTIAAHTQKE